MRFHFYSNEGDPREPVHIHMMRGDVDAKFWLHPAVTVAYNRGFNAREQATLARIIEDRRDEIEGPGMITSVRPLAVRFEADVMWVELEDGRTLGVPLAWFPRLLHGSPAERAEVTLSPSGLHWEALDEDVSIAGLLAGRGDVTRAPSHAA